MKEMSSSDEGHINSTKIVRDAFGKDPLYRQHRRCPQSTLVNFLLGIATSQEKILDHELAFPPVPDRSSQQNPPCCREWYERETEAASDTSQKISRLVQHNHLTIAVVRFSLLPLEIRLHARFTRFLCSRWRSDRLGEYLIDLLQKRFHPSK